MNVRLSHVSLGCNRVANALDWGANNIIAYGGHNQVALYDAPEAVILATLLGHTGRVNCVRWLPSSESDSVHYLASGAADNIVLLWAWKPAEAAEPWSCIARLEGHSGAVNSIEVQQQADGTLLLVSTAGDAEVHIWECVASADAPPAAQRFGQQQWRLRQTVETGFKMQLCIALTHLPASPGWMMMALGGVDTLVRLLVAAPGGDFHEVAKLAGHQDWVRALAFAHVASSSAAAAGAGERLLLASASQDKYVRLWAIRQQHMANGTASPSSTASASSLARYAPQPRLQAGGSSYTASLEALLVGHEDWVHSVAWQPPAVPDTGGAEQPLCLLSSSMDRTMILWRPDAATGLWMSEEAVGDAGASSLGYFGGCFAPDGRGIVAHGYTGALHLWGRQGGGAGGSRGGSWVPQHALGGHFGAVVDLCWGLDGRCLLSASADQTTRIHTRCGGHWCEIARPQVHGHDFECVASIPTGGSERHLYASGSEEKVIRVFEAPGAFLQTLSMARGEQNTAGSSAALQDGGRALGAAVAALGLSNKAVYAADEPSGGVSSGQTGGSYTEGPDMAPNASPSAVAGPPLEEHLSQNTLWPEIRKLYGHGNDLYCLAADPSGRILASACKAQTAATATIWLWDMATWDTLGALPAHTLTVTQLAFSHNGRYLLSGSRDRTFAVFERCESIGQKGEPPFRLLGKVAKAHARIIWSVSWAPDDSCFATGARDNLVKFWAMIPEGPSQKPIITLPAFQSSVTSVAFASAGNPSSAAGTSYQLAVGLESGCIEVWTVSTQGAAQAAAQVLDWRSPPFVAHSASVRRLCWQPSGEEGLQLASCSEDHSVRVFSVTRRGDSERGG